MKRKNGGTIPIDPKPVASYCFDVAKLKLPSPPWCAKNILYAYWTNYLEIS